MNYKQWAAIALFCVAISYYVHQHTPLQPDELADGAIIEMPIADMDTMQIAEDASEHFIIPEQSWTISSAFKFNFPQGESVEIRLEKVDGLENYQLVCQRNGVDIDCSSLRFFCEDDKGQKIDCKYQPLESWRLIP